MGQDVDWIGAHAHLNEDCYQVHPEEWHCEECPAIGVDEVHDEHEHDVQRQREQQEHTRRLRVHTWALKRRSERTLVLVCKFICAVASIARTS